MSTQVMRLEELLNRVQTNRVKMERQFTERQTRRRSLAAPLEVSDDATTTPLPHIDDRAGGAKVPMDSEVIELVNPTSIPPAIAQPKSEDDFSSVVPVSNPAPSPVEEMPADSISGAAMSAVELSTPGKVALEADVAPEFLSPEVVSSSVLPAASGPLESVIPSAEVFSEAPLSVMPISPPVPIEPEDSSFAADEDELDLVDSDSVETLESSAPVQAGMLETELQAISQRTVEFSRESFVASASATGPVVTMSGEIQPKTWTLNAVLERAWKLGRTE